VLSVIFTVLTVSLVINGFNMVDGFNGLLSGLSILYLLAIIFVAYSLGDTVTYNLSVYLCYGVIGFLVFNFPIGKIFLGDLGAYFLGFIISFILLSFANKNYEISHWFSLNLIIYPIYEVIFSILRKKFIFKVRALEPDQFHLHMLVHKGLVNCKWFKKKTYCNSFTSVYIWLLNTIPVLTSIIFYNDNLMLILSTVIFMVIYTLSYYLIYSMDKK